MSDREPKVILFHGCNAEELRGILGAIRTALGNERYKDLAFCTSTPTNMDWTVKHLIADVWEEHEYMRENPTETDA